MGTYKQNHARKVNWSKFQIAGAMAALKHLTYRDPVILDGRSNDIQSRLFQLERDMLEELNLRDKEWREMVEQGEQRRAEYIANAVPTTCVCCGGRLIGDGYQTVVHCEYAEDIESYEPDSGIVFCTHKED